MGTYDSAKRRYFRACRDVDVYSRYRSSRADKGGPARDDEPAAVPNNDDVTVFGAGFGPRGPGGARYLAACTSNGEIAVWSSPASGSPSREPVARWRARRDAAAAAGGDTLYDLQFVRNGGEDQLVASGNRGVLVYRWSDVLDWIDSESDGGGPDGGAAPSGRGRCQDPPARRPEPAATLQPSPHRPTNFNSAASPGDGTLYAAAGDGSCYRYDLASGTLLGTLGGRGGGGGGRSGGRARFLHVVRALPADAACASDLVLTGGEGGDVGFWDGKERRLVGSVHVPSAMNERRGLVTSDLPLPSSSRSFLVGSAAPPSIWGNATRSWVSSADANGNWLAVCGGAESTPGGTGGTGGGLSSSSSRASGPGRCGFASLFHLPTRTFAGGRVTRECVSAVVYSEGLGNFVTGGNEARLSFWGGTSFSSRVGRSWTSVPAAYALTADGPSGLVVGGVGNVMDCLAGKSRVSSYTL